MSIKDMSLNFKKVVPGIVAGAVCLSATAYDVSNVAQEGKAVQPAELSATTQSVLNSF